mmetsp:Transcript_16973/g.18333  ORF Transcript_16973/g.18333 Transcript_16973/m.18333 type:complete len:184 (+) Transcript_16973:65-616(+)
MTTKATTRKIEEGGGEGAALERLSSLLHDDEEEDALLVTSQLRVDDIDGLRHNGTISRCQELCASNSSAGGEIIIADGNSSTTCNSNNYIDITLCTSTMMNEVTTIPVTPDYNYSMEGIYENEYYTTPTAKNTASWQYSQNNNDTTAVTSSTTVFSYSTPTDDSSTGGAGSVTEVIEVIDDDW